MGIRLRESCVTISNKAGAGISDSPWAGSVLPSPPYSLRFGQYFQFTLESPSVDTSQGLEMLFYS